MEEKPKEESNNKLEDVFKEEKTEEDIEIIKEEEIFDEEKSIKKSEQIDSNNSTNKNEEELREEFGEKTEEVENLEELKQESERSLIEEPIGEKQGGTTSNSAEVILDNTIIDEKSLEQETRAFHRNLIEAALYAAGGPLSIEELSTKLEFPKKEVEELVNELAFDYLDRSTALIIAQIGERYQMQIRPEYTEEVSKFAKGGAIAEKYLRTLTVIALKQPILKSMVVKLRGTGAYEHVKYLINNGFLNAIKKGRSHELTTTDKYADMFGLPKDIRLMKQAMITQLGIEEGGESELPAESEGVNHSEPIEEDETESVIESNEGEK